MIMYAWLMTKYIWIYRRGHGVYGINLGGVL